MSPKVKEFPLQERPYERFKKYGYHSLSNAELLAILLRNGSKNKSAIDLSNEIIQSIEHIQCLKEMTLEELSTFKGIGEVKAIQLLAAIELGKRVLEGTTFQKKVVLNHPQVIYDTFKTNFISLKQEVFLCLYLSVHKELIKSVEIFRGSLDQVVIHPREIFREAYRFHAHSIIVIHNHPSNYCKPSKNDIEVTNRLIHIGNIMGIPVMDHLIFTEHEYYSFKQNGYIQMENDWN